MCRRCFQKNRQSVKSLSVLVPHAECYNSDRILYSSPPLFTDFSPPQCFSDDCDYKDSNRKNEMRKKEHSEDLASTSPAGCPWAVASRMLAVSGAFTLVVLCQLIGFCNGTALISRNQFRRSLAAPLLKRPSTNLSTLPLPLSYTQEQPYTHTHTLHH